MSSLAIPCKLLPGRVSTTWFACAMTLSDTAAAVVQPDDPDIAAMARVAIGDEAALGEIIDRWEKPLRAFLYRSLRSWEDAEDLAQVTFIRLYRVAPRYEPSARFSTFLFTIARRLLLNEYRRRSRKPAEPTAPEDFGHLAGENDSERQRFEIEEALHNALNDVPEKQRTALLLHQQQGLRYSEIAKMMKASESAVKSWIFRARQHLREALQDLR